MPIFAGSFASLVNKYIISNPKFDVCCTTVEPEELDSESDDTTKTKLSDTLNEASGTAQRLYPFHTLFTQLIVFIITHVINFMHACKLFGGEINTSTNSTAVR